jgi:hypothetical protein
MKLHQKGYMLVLLAELQVEWDNVLIDKALKEYRLAGKYWVNHFRTILDELASAGLIRREDYRLEDSADRLVFKYALTGFGRQRILDTGLLD